MGPDQITKDLEHLAGRLPHRGPNTENERLAAEYIARRLREHAADVVQEPFDSTDSWALLFSAYYCEFVVVALLAIFFPTVSFLYACFVFTAYLGEFTGYHFLTRFLPQYASQNVLGRLMADRPRRLVIITAHYDSGRSTWLSEPWLVPWLRWLHVLLVCCMAAVVAIGAAEAIGRVGDPALDLLRWVRWLAVAGLLSAGIFLLLNERRAAYTRGAVHNASGVAAMLVLAQQFERDPLEETEIWLLATGSHTSGLNGIHQFLRHQELDRAMTYFVNLDSVGAGTLAYTTGEGMLYVFSTAKECMDAARRNAPTFGATPMPLTSVPSDMLVPLARGYKCISIVGADKRGVPELWQSPHDRLDKVDVDKVIGAARFAEAIIRDIRD